MPVLLLVTSLFIGVPLLEIYLLIQIGGVIGAGYTIALVIGTAVLGVALLRAQSLNTLFSARAQLRRGQLPAMEMAEGLLLALSGVLLLTPGFFTDGVGFALLIPPLRRAWVRRVMPHVRVAGVAATASSTSTTGAGESTIIEGEYRRTDSDK